MGFSFSKVGLATWAPTRGRNYPVQPQMQDNSVRELTEAGTGRVSVYSLDRIHRFVIKDLPVAEYNTLLVFFFGVGRMRDSFTFTDESAATQPTRFFSGDLKPADPDSRYVDVDFSLIEENYA